VKGKEGTMSVSRPREPNAVRRLGREKMPRYHTGSRPQFIAHICLVVLASSTAGVSDEGPSVRLLIAFGAASCWRSLGAV